MVWNHLTFRRHLLLAALIAPDQRRADHPVVLIEHGKTVHLA